MNKLINKKNNLFRYALISSIIFPIALLCLILSVVFHFPLYQIPFIIGIVFTVLTFYAVPLFWTFYGSCFQPLKICDLVFNRRILEVKTMVKVLHQKERIVSRSLISMVDKGYLDDYYLEGDILKSSTQNVPTSLAKCFNCGANLDFETHDVCPYCGHKFQSKNNLLRKNK
jgi:uncharacterized paraquat-inducible protein A